MGKIVVLLFFFVTLHGFQCAAVMLQSSAVRAMKRTMAHAKANPVRKVVTLLQKMEKKSVAQGKKEQMLYDKYKCFCEKGAASLKDSIEDANTKVPALQANIKESVSKEQQLSKDIKDHKAERTASEKAFSEASAMRDKDSRQHKADVADDRAAIDSVEKAVAALAKGVGGFLQTGVAAKLRKLVAMERNDLSVLETERDTLASFLSGSQEGVDGGEVIGILKQMKDEMVKRLEEIESAEATAIKEHEELGRAKKKELAALSKMIEDKLTRQGELAVSIETDNAELANTLDGMAEDKRLLDQLNEGCKTADADFIQQQSLRRDEGLALSQTIKILNDDEALGLFKKTLPSASASFLQVAATSSSRRSQALRILQAAKIRSSQHRRRGLRKGLDVVVAALQGKKVAFDKVLKMLDGMIASLKKEQGEDDKKKVFCGNELDTLEDEQKALKREIKDLGTGVSKNKEAAAALQAEIAKITKGIKGLDKSVEEATAMRQAENEEYKKVIANNNAAKELLKLAAKKLEKFYTAKTALSQQHSKPRPLPVATDSPTSFLQIAGEEIRSDGVLAYTKQSEEAMGALQMIDYLISDLDREVVQANVEEKGAQEDYDKLLTDAAEKRRQDSKALTAKEKSVSETQAAVEEGQGTQKSTKKELEGNAMSQMALHSECDFLVQYYDQRKKARANEIDALTKSKDVLRGAAV